MQRTETGRVDRSGPGRMYSVCTRRQLHVHRPLKQRTGGAHLTCLLSRYVCCCLFNDRTYSFLPHPSISDARHRTAPKLPESRPTLPLASIFFAPTPIVDCSINHRLMIRGITTMGSPVEFRYLSRSFSDVVDSSGAFSECNSDRSGEFSAPGSPVSGGSGGGRGKAGALHRLLISCAPDNSDELIVGLVSDLESLTASIDLQRRAAMEIRLLAKHSPENRLKIARAGAVRPLISLLSHPDPVLQENGVTAILNLSLCDENKYLVAGAGAIKPLVRVLKTGTPVARENAACALLRLSQIDEHKVAIGLSGAIPLLVDLLQSGGHRAKKDASTALYSLCSTRDNKIRAVQAGIVRPLLDLMSEPESGMVDKAAYVLFNIVGVDEGRVAAVEEDCIPVLVEIIEVGTQRQKEIAAATLLLICEGSVSCRAVVVREGAIPPLVALSQSGSSRAKQKAEALVELLRQPRGTAGAALVQGAVWAE